MVKYKELHGDRFSGLTKNEVKLVYNTYNETFESTAVTQIETQYSGSQNSVFLCRSTTFVDKDKMQHMSASVFPSFLLSLCINW